LTKEPANPTGDEKENLGSKLDSQFNKTASLKEGRKDLFKPKKSICKQGKKDTHNEKPFNPLQKKTFLEDHDYMGLNNDQNMGLDQKQFFGLDPQFQIFGGMNPAAMGPQYINYNNFENITQNIYIQGPQGLIDPNMQQFTPQPMIVAPHQMQMAAPVYIQKPEPYKSRFAPPQFVEQRPSDMIDYDKHCNMRKGSSNSRITSNGRIRSTSGYKQPRPYQTKNFFNQTMNQMAHGKNNQLDRSGSRRKVYFNQQPQVRLLAQKQFNQALAPAENILPTTPGMRMNHRYSNDFTMDLQTSQTRGETSLSKLDVRMKEHSNEPVQRYNLAKF
jgi:hypothetical protein